MSARRLAIAFVLAICLGAPTVELFDTWDAPSARGSDTELSALIVALCVGAAFAARLLVAKLCRPQMSNRTRLDVASARVGLVSYLGAVPVPCIRPPTLLRI